MTGLQAWVTSPDQNTQEALWNTIIPSENNKGFIYTCVKANWKLFRVKLGIKY